MSQLPGALPLGPEVRQPWAQQAVHGYRLARAAEPGASRITALHLGAEQTVMASGVGPEPDEVAVLPLGTERTARECFRQDPPSAAELELAIAQIEDHVMPCARRPLAGARLVSADASLQALAGLSGATTSEVLRLESVERLFDRVAALSQGRPVAHDPVLAHRPVAATVLILRELMHHLAFDHLDLLRVTA